MSPIADISALTLTRPVESTLELLLPIVKVENSSRNGDETYSPSGGKSARGSEDNESEDQHDDLPGDGETQTPAIEKNQTHQISFFA